MSIKYVEYLEADGNSYFELPAGTITWNNDSGIEVQYYHNAYAGFSYLIGAYGQNGNTCIYTYYEQLNIFMFRWEYSQKSKSVSAMSSGDVPSARSAEVSPRAASASVPFPSVVMISCSSITLPKTSDIFR